MKPPLTRPLRFAELAAFAGLLLGGGLAAVELARSPFVMEFQSGLGSSFSEKLRAGLQRAAGDALGCGALGLLLGVAAIPLARLQVGVRSSPTSGSFVAGLCHAGVALLVWVLWGAPLARAALPFLRPAEDLALQFTGYAALAVGMAVYTRLGARGARQRDEAPLALAFAAWVTVALLLILWREVWRGGAALALRMSTGLAFSTLGLLVVARLGALIQRRCSALTNTLGSLHLPRPVRLAAWGTLLSAMALGRPFLALGVEDEAPHYARQGSSAPASRPNVVFVVIDTLRADHLSCYGYPHPTSPFLDELAAGGARCADSAAPAAWTKPSTGTLLTGLFPSRHGALHHGSSLRLPEGHSTLAETFQRAGYATAGFVSNPNIKRAFDFDRGFAEYFDSPAEDTVARASLRGSLFGRLLTVFTGLQFNWKYENDARAMNRHVGAWLDANAAERFFLYVHYIDPHEPYAPPREFGRLFERDAGWALFEERQRRVGIDLYDGEIRYVDEALRELASELARHGVLEDTLLVVTSDHGEEFFEHGVFGHGFSLYQPVVGVPLIANGPGVGSGIVVQDPVQLVDLPATLLDLAGLGNRLGDGASFALALRGEAWTPPEHLQLENEFGRDEGDTRSYVLFAVREGPWKLVLTEANRRRPPSDPRYGPLELYHLGEDPGETHNRIDEPGLASLRARLLGKLREHREWLETHGLRGATPDDLGADTEAALKALGYL